jgi:hypothetical protein
MPLGHNYHNATDIYTETDELVGRQSTPKPPIKFGNARKGV